MVKVWVGLALGLAAGPALADAPASPKRLNCFAGRVVNISVSTGAAAVLDFTIDPGPLGSYSQFQAAAVPAEVFAGWATMLTQAYLQNVVITIEYTDPVRPPQPVAAIIFSHDAVAKCSYRSPLPPIVSVQPAR